MIVVYQFDKNKQLVSMKQDSNSKISMQWKHYGSSWEQGEVHSKHHLSLSRHLSMWEAAARIMSQRSRISGIRQGSSCNLLRRMSKWQTVCTVYPENVVSTTSKHCHNTTVVYPTKMFDLLSGNDVCFCSSINFQNIKNGRKA